MARPKTNQTPDAKDAQARPAGEPLASALTVLSVPGGWVVRTYLIGGDSVTYEDSAVDTFAACMGRATRDLARVAR